MRGKSGTAVFLCDVRCDPERPDRMIYEFVDNSDDNADSGIGSGAGSSGENNSNEPDLHFLAPGSTDDDPCPFDEFYGQYGQVAPMDYFFLAYLSLRFMTKQSKLFLVG